MVGEYFKFSSDIGDDYLMVLMLMLNKDFDDDFYDDADIVKYICC